MHYSDYQIVEEIRYKMGKGTINSIKKNTFPDLARAGLLDRYDKSGNKIFESFSKGEDKTQNKRKAVYYVSLSSLAVQFAEAKTEFERRKYYTDAIDKLTNNAASDLVELLSTNVIFDNINILEFMYVLSDDRIGVNYNDKLLYLLDYRKLSDPQKGELTKLLQEYCDPKRNVGSKINARDYHNWKNESQQIFGLLSNSTYFNVINDNLILNNGQYGLFVQSAKRSTKPKDEYFKYHSIKPVPNYELHHIIPFKRANNQQDAHFIDDKRNMIYLSASKHAEFTKTQNVNIRASYTAPNLLFLQLDSIDQVITVNLANKEALLSAQHINEVVDYNRALLKKFY